MMIWKKYSHVGVKSGQFIETLKLSVRFCKLGQNLTFQEKSSISQVF